MVKENVLIVDPDQAVGRLMSMLLEVMGYNVDVVQFPEEATKLQQRRRFDLMITEAFDQTDSLSFDVNFLGKLRTDDIPIILCSTYVAIAAIHPGCGGLADVVAKPFEIDDLLKKVNGILHHRQ